MQGNWEMFFRRVLADEGTKYESVPGDNGGPTKCGITIVDVARWNHVALTKANYEAMTQKVRDLDVATASCIYKALYWDAVRADDLPSGLDYAVCDYGVNSGTSKSISTLCALVGVAAKSITDDVIAAINRYGDLEALINHFQDARRAFLLEISQRPSQMKFRTGWLDRENRVRQVAIKMAGQSDKLPPITAFPKAVPPSAPVVPTRVEVAVKSQSFWSGLTALAAWAVSQSQDVLHRVTDAIDVALGILPDAIGAGTASSEAVTSLGSLVKADLGWAVAAVGIVATMNFIWRHVDFKHGTLVQSATQGIPS